MTNAAIQNNASYYCDEVKIDKSKNLGNTFTGLVCAAFQCKASDVSIDPHLQYPDSGCGTVKVLGKYFDWYDQGQTVSFRVAE